MPAQPNGTAVTLASQEQMQIALAEARKTPFGLRIPKSAVPVTSIGYAEAAAYGTQALLTTYQAKSGYVLLITGIVLQFQGNGQAPNPGDVNFTVDIDRALGDTTGGYTEKDYGAIPILLGSFTQGWVWPCEFRHVNNEIIRIKGTPVANMGVGAGNSLIGCLLGFEWPQMRHDGF